MRLRPYQQTAINETKSILARYKAAMLQLLTGLGKTFVFANITEMARSKDKRVWIIVPRNELLRQSSDTLRAMKIPHGIINAKSNESRAYEVHVASKDTLTRRIKADKIKNWPDLIVFDEAHLNLDAQIRIAEAAPEKTKIIGVTATPERLDGRGLSELYGDISYGPSMQWAIENGYLSNFKYFCPPTEGIDKLHRKGTDYDQKELQELLERKRIFGSAIQHYKQYADKKPCLVFCRSVAAAEDTALRFQAAGYKFLSIDGKMTYEERKKRIEALRNGEIHGLTSCELITYGLDVPVVGCVIMLRPTLSRTLFFQMIGRGLRPSPGKEFCIILDHVNNLLEHGHPIDEHEWNFHGTEKSKKKKGDDIAMASLCPNCFMYFKGDRCDNCNAEKEVKVGKGLVEVEGRLVEIQGPVKLADRPPEEKTEISARIKAFVEARDIKGLLEVADDLGYKPLWVHRQLVDEGQVNVDILKEIAQIKGYKSGWVKLHLKGFRR